MWSSKILTHALQLQILFKAAYFHTSNISYLIRQFVVQLKTSPHRTMSQEWKFHLKYQTTLPNPFIFISNPDMLYFLRYFPCLCQKERSRQSSKIMLSDCLLHQHTHIFVCKRKNSDCNGLMQLNRKSKRLKLIRNSKSLVR